MTEAMPFLQKTILLSYDPQPLRGDFFCRQDRNREQSDERVYTISSTVLPPLRAFLTRT